jgi:ATP-dependent RNA helicase DHX29
LFEIERPHQRNKNLVEINEKEDLEVAKLLGRIDRIEKDVLFDNYYAEQQWKVKKIALEKDYAFALRQKNRQSEEAQKSTLQEVRTEAEDAVSKEAERIAAEIIAEEYEDDDNTIADLFASLPVAEVDSTTGKTNTVIKNEDGTSTVIRDFGKWTGVSPVRALEEACRSRYELGHLDALVKWKLISFITETLQ